MQGIGMAIKLITTLFLLFFSFGSYSTTLVFSEKVPRICWIKKVDVNDSRLEFYKNDKNGNAIYTINTDKAKAKSKKDDLISCN